MKVTLFMILKIRLLYAHLPKTGVRNIWRMKTEAKTTELAEKNGRASAAFEVAFHALQQ